MIWVSIPCSCERNFLCCKTSRPTVVLTLHHVRWVLGVRRLDVVDCSIPLSNAELKEWSCASSPPLCLHGIYLFISAVTISRWFLQCYINSGVGGVEPNRVPHIVAVLDTWDSGLKSLFCISVWLIQSPTECDINMVLYFCIWGPR